MTDVREATMFSSSARATRRAASSPNASSTGSGKGASRPTAPAAIRRAASTRMRWRCLKRLNYPTETLRSKSWDGVRRALADRARFRVYGLRQRRGRGLPGLAGTADVGALGHSRSGGGRRLRGGDRARRSARPTACSTTAFRSSSACRSPSLDALSLQKRLDDIGRTRDAPARAAQAEMRLSREPTGVPQAR